MSEDQPFKVGDRVRMAKEWADLGDDPIGSVVELLTVNGSPTVRVQWDGGPRSDYAPPVLVHAESV